MRKLDRGLTRPKPMGKLDVLAKLREGANRTAMADARGHATMHHHDNDPHTQS